MHTTNVKASELNYNKYTSDKYDRDIVNSIPFHREIHRIIQDFVKSVYSSREGCDVLDLGAGTGITSRLIKDAVPNVRLELVDFSRRMLDGARKKLGKDARYILGDYSKHVFTKKYDIIVSVIGIHHQNTVGKKRLFKRIYSMLKPGGIFIFGDLVTYRNKKAAALNHAKHYKHLVDKATDEKTLTEWAYHHMYLNDLAPVEDQIMWLKDTGFIVEKKFLKLNTALLVCTRKH